LRKRAPRVARPLLRRTRAQDARRARLNRDEEETMPTPHNFLAELVGCFATPIAENPTVAMIESAFRHHGMNARYINCEVQPAALGEAARGARAMGWRGFNCSLPHKVAIIQHLDGLGQSAATIGAVNCAVRRGDKWIGENTDGVGFMKSLATLIDARGKSIVVFGAGGAARAIAVEAALAGARHIAIVNRSVARGRELADLVDAKTPATAEFIPWNKSYRARGEDDVFVNATSIGLYPDVEGRVDADLSAARRDAIVADVIPNPPRTLFLREAEARGLRTLDGLGMLVNQGVVSIRHWFGVDVEASVMRRTLEDLFAI
jgi:shikimate dehydrogenase